MKKIHLLFSLLLSIMGVNAQNLAEIEAKADQKVEHYGFTEAFRNYLTCIEQSKDIDTHIRIIKKVTKVIDEKRIYINKEALQAIDTLIKKIHPLHGSDCKYYLPLIEKRIIKISSQYGGDYKQEVFLYNEAIDIRTSNNLLQGAEYEELLSWFMKISVYRKDVSNEDRLKSAAT